MVEYSDYYFRSFRCRADMVQSLRLYADTGVPVGDFLKGMLTNDLRRAMEFADDDNLTNLAAVYGYIYNKIPAGCWGSPKAYKLHLKRFQQEKKSEPE